MTATARPGAAPAWVAAGLGVLFAAVSAYWALGGTWLLDTVEGSLAEAGRRRDVGVIAVVWVSVVLKLVAAALGAGVVHARPGAGAARYVPGPRGWPPASSPRTARC